MDNISQIKSKIDIVDLVGSYVQLKKSGKNYKGLCPFHGEKTPSFMVSPELQIYKCFGCGESGDIFTFVEKTEGIDFSTALENLAERAGVELEKGDYDKNSLEKKKILQINDVAQKFYEYVLWKHPLGKPALNYLKGERKLEDVTIKDFGLGYAPDSWDALHNFFHKKGLHDGDVLKAGLTTVKTKGKGFIDKFRGRIIIPLRDTAGKTVGFAGRTIFKREPKYLNSPETPVFHKSTFVYGLNKAKVAAKTQGLVLVEGYLDVITAFQNGIKNIVAASGTSLTLDQLKTISRYTKDITLCFDPDTAGINAAYRAISLAEGLGFNIKVLSIPKDYKDLDDLMRKDLGKAKDLLAQGVSAYDFFVADNLSKHDKKSAQGKKKILENLAPLLSKITNIVVLEHYIKELSTELESTEENIREILLGKAKYETSENSKEPTEKEGVFEKMSKKSPHAYFISLVLKLFNIDTVGKFVYKLDPESFENTEIKQVFEGIRHYLSQKPKNFDIREFIKILKEPAVQTALDLHLWDLPSHVENEEQLVKELASVAERLEKEQAKEKIKLITNKLRIAEQKGDSEEVKQLSEEVETLKSKLF